MKKTLIATAIAFAAVNASASNLQGPAPGMSGAAYVTGDYADAVRINPSMGAAYNPDEDDFSFSIGGGAVLYDKYDLITKFDDLVDLTDQIESSDMLNLSQAQELKRRLQAVDEKDAGVSANFGVSVAIPNQYLSAALVVDANVDISLMADISQNDYDIIDNAIGGYFDPSAELTSEIIGLGALKTEVGVALSKSFQLENGHYLLAGFHPKRVEVETIAYAEQIADYDEDDFDSDEYTVKDSAMNYDLGLTYVVGNIRYGLVAKNLREQSFDTVYEDISLKIKRQLTSSVGYMGEKFSAEASLDLNATPQHSFADDSRFLRAGVEYRPFSWVKLRAGLQQDMEDTLPNTYSFGLGLGRSFNISYITGDDSTEGFALSGGFRF
jgi:hypothetical protein